jgi:hypothetical protein
VLADDGMRPDDRAGAEPGVGMHDRARIDGHAVAALSRLVGQPHQELGLGRDVVADVGDRVRAGQPGPPRPHRDLEPEPVAGNHRQPELGAVDPAQIRAPGRARVRQQDRGDLRQRLDHQHARHQRRAGKMPLEEFLVDGDVLDGDDAPAGLVLRDGIDEQ